MHAHFAGFARQVKDEELCGEGGLVVDIGSNDGLFLVHVKAQGLRTLGIEPASNLAELARKKGIEVVNEYFNPAIARRVRQSHGAATVIVTTNTFNHIDDLHDFVEGVAALLADDGVFIVEVPQAVDYVEHNEFDTVYHEHLSVFSVESFVRLLSFFDMHVAHLERLEIHGGSMRVFCRRKGDNRPASEAVEKWRGREGEARLFDRDTYERFAGRIERIRRDLMAILEERKKQGRRMVGYGAPAKGNTLLNYYRIGPGLLDYLVDRSPLKHGLYSPGMHIPIVPPERLEQDRPDDMLILAWNFAEEIMGQQSAFARRGGRFIIPVPQPHVVG